MHAKILVGLVLATVSIASHAADWRVIEKYPDVVVSVDMSSIEYDGTLALIWETDTYTTPQKIPPNITGKVARQRQIFDCVHRQVSIAALVACDENGNPGTGCPFVSRTSLRGRMRPKVRHRFRPQWVRPDPACPSRRASIVRLYAADRCPADTIFRGARAEEERPAPSRRGTSPA